MCVVLCTKCRLNPIEAGLFLALRWPGEGENNDVISFLFKLLKLVTEGDVNIAIFTEPEVTYCFSNVALVII